MIKKKILDAFNKQLNEELFSSYLYLSMAAYFESENLNGMAHWMRTQSQEEMVHAMKFFDFINERGGRVKLAQIKAPKTEWKSPLDAFGEAYKHECAISGMIHKLADLSIAEKDHATQAFLQWFVTEQVEEEATALDVVEKLKFVGDNKAALFMFDSKLGERQSG